MLASTVTYQKFQSIFPKKGSQAAPQLKRESYSERQMSKCCTASPQQNEWQYQKVKKTFFLSPSDTQI